MINRRLNQTAGVQQYISGVARLLFLSKIDVQYYIIFTIALQTIDLKYNLRIDTRRCHYNILVR